MSEKFSFLEELYRDVQPTRELKLPTEDKPKATFIFRVPEKSMTVPSSSLTDHQPWPTVPLTRITALPSWRMAPQPSQTAPAALRKARTTSPKVPSRSPTERIRSRMHWIRTGCVNFPERSPPCAKT